MAVAGPTTDIANRWEAVGALFDRVLPLDRVQRDELLADPALDPGLVSEVRSLLDHADEHDEEFLGKPALTPEPQDEHSRQGLTLGPWRIVSLLGSGGMGEVWLAERADGTFEAHAAIKVLKRGMDSDAVLARFASEQQILARLSHPNIARLLDAGRTPDGVPYFVMEHVSGRPIDSACEGLSVPARLQLFLQLADAVAYAHRHLLVHRDLKPGNVLVDDDGQVKLLDFGIAKALQADGEATLTRHGRPPYTPHYASPEQVRGEPDSTSTDVYSLGVLLYLLLTGQRPYGREASNATQAARAVLEEAPRRPEMKRHGAGSDLDNILLKALEKTPERRYPSVDALASDLRAYLAGNPVSARPASQWYLLRRWTGRNRLATGLAALATLSLLGGLVGTAWQMQRADRARDAAERRFTEVRQLAKQLVFRYHDQIRSLPGAVEVRQALLDDAARYLDGLAAESRGDQALARELAETYHRLSLLQGEMFSPSQERVLVALANAQKATGLLPAYLDRGDTDLAAINTGVDMWLNRGTIEARLGRMARSVESLRLAGVLAERARMRAPDDLQVISRLATLQGRIALALGSHVSQASLGQVEAARPHWDHAVALFDELVRRDPGNVEWIHQLAWGWVGQLNWALLAGRFDEAVASGRRAVALRDRASAMKPDDVHLAHQRATVRNNIATALSLAGDHAAALRFQGEALQLVEQSLVADPQNKAARRDRALFVLSRARPLHGLGRDSEALVDVRAALLALPAEAVLPDDFYLARWRAEALVWAARLQRENDPTTAIALAREAVALLQAQVGEEHATRRWTTAQAQCELAQGLRSAGQAAAAAEAAREALRLWGTDPPGYFAAQWQIAKQMSL